MGDKTYKIISQEINKDVFYVQALDKEEALEIYDDIKHNSPDENEIIFNGIIDIQVVPEKGGEYGTHD